MPRHRATLADEVGTRGGACRAAVALVGVAVAAIGMGTAIDGAEASWSVPAVRPSDTPLYSSSWVGVDGLHNHDLIQVGSAQETEDGYYAWYEILPAPEIVIIQPSSGEPALVEPGDRMDAYVQQTSPQAWTIYIKDATRKWYFELTNVGYTGPRSSAEWIEEAPNVNGQQSILANFGKVAFSTTGVYETVKGVLGWYSTALTAKNEIAMVNLSDTRILAVASAPSPRSRHGQRFTDRYITAPGRPTDLKATAEVGAVHLTWMKPASDGGTVITRYDVRVFRFGVLLRTLVATTRAITVGRLTAGEAYAFSVAAHSFGNYTSAYSTRTPVVRPLG